MATPMNHDSLLSAHRAIIDKNKVNQGLIYLQITRGSAGDRDFIFPDPETTPQTVVMFSQNKENLVDNPSAVSGIKVISIEDQRWGRRDIKTTQLLYPSIGKMMAQKLNADDAWMVEDGYVTEGTSNNAYIIKDGKIITRAKSYAILHGITRSAIIRFAEEAEMEIEERNFSINEAINADEAFITSASSFVTPVVNIDGQNISHGSPGPMTQRLRKIYLDESMKTAI
jgi:D-alanine transaminase